MKKSCLYISVPALLVSSLILIHSSQGLAYVTPISQFRPTQACSSRYCFSSSVVRTFPTPTSVKPGPTFKPIHRESRPTSLHAADLGDMDASSEVEKKSWIRRIFPKKENDGLTTRQRLAKMGLATLLSYGFVSNLSSVCLTILSWYTFNKRTGLSPLAPGQWKGFTAIYAGFYIVNNFLRPFRIAASVGISKYFDMAINNIQKRTNFPKGVCIGLVVFASNFVIVSSLFVGGVFLASTLSGVPVFPPKV